MARPTKYKPEYHPQEAYELCAEFGCTDKQLAKRFKVSEDTINNWKKAYPEEFFVLIRAGKDYYNSKKIERSLIKRGMGYRYTETIRAIRSTKELGSDGVMITGAPRLTVVKTISKHVPGDVHAQKFMLINRSPERWSDKQKLDLAGDLGINVNEMTDERKAELKELAALRVEIALRDRRESKDGA